VLISPSTRPYFFEGSLKVQGRPTANKEEKDNDFLTNLPIFGLFAYGQIKQIFEEENAKADDVRTFITWDFLTKGLKIR